jgi:hypothetical protein
MNLIVFNQIHACSSRVRSAAIMELRYVSRSACSAQRMRAYTRQRGTICGRRVWLAEEISVLHRWSTDPAALADALPTRTPKAVKAMRQKLGLTRRKHTWTAAERVKLRAMYAKSPREAILAAFPDVSWKGISDRARSWGSSRDIPPYSITGNQLLDAIRRRCRDIGYSMSDLDELAGTGKFFAKAHWRCRRPTAGPIAKAVAVLGGELTISWKE